MSPTMRLSNTAAGRVQALVLALLASPIGFAACATADTGEPAESAAVATARQGETQAQGQEQRPGQEQATTFRRTVIVAIDSLNPVYPFLNSTATGPGVAGDLLMPNVRRFIEEEAAFWPVARAHFPYATDMNHLNVLAGTHSGLSGIMGVSSQPARWGKLDVVYEPTHHTIAKYSADGNQVQTLFDILGRAGGKTAIVSNKAWVAEFYGEQGQRPGVVDIWVNGHNWSQYSYLSAPSFLSFYDNPVLDGDYATDPEAWVQLKQLRSGELLSDPNEHPRDFWVADAAIKVLDNNEPDLTYVLLGDLDHAQHFLGSVDNQANTEESDWFDGWAPPGIDPSLCSSRPSYCQRSKRDPELLKEPILDLIRDVDTAFGRLLGQLKQRDDYADLDVILLSDHNMTNYLIRGEELEPYTDILTVLGPELTPKRNFHMFGAGSLAYLFWRPEPFVGPNPPPMSRDEMIEQARAKLMQHKTPHPVTGESECPWFVLDRAAMEAGSNGIGIGPMEFLNNYYAANKVWPDLVLLARDGWHLPGGNGHVDLPDWIKLRFNAGHGSVDTARVMLAVKGLGFSAGARCAEEARLSDVGVTLLQTTYASTGEQFPYSVGKMLTCTPTP